MRFAIVLFMLLVRVRCRFIFVAALVVIAVAMIEGADLSRAVAVTKVATHDAKHLCPTQREKREGNEQWVRASGHDGLSVQTHRIGQCVFAALMGALPGVIGAGATLTGSAGSQASGAPALVSTSRSMTTLPDWRLLS